LLFGLVLLAGGGFQETVATFAGGAAGGDLAAAAGAMFRPLLLGLRSEDFGICHFAGFADDLVGLEYRALRVNATLRISRFAANGANGADGTIGFGLGDAHRQAA
jgi:hypothetical protein